MNYEMIKQILETRLKVSEKQGNTTEKSLINELLKMADEYNQLKLKEQERAQNER